MAYNALTLREAQNALGILVLKNCHCAKCVGPLGYLRGAWSRLSNFWYHGIMYLRLPFWHSSWISWYRKVKTPPTLETSGTTKSATQRNNPEDPTQHEYCGNLKFRSPKVRYHFNMNRTLDSFLIQLILVRNLILSRLMFMSTIYPRRRSTCKFIAYRPMFLYFDTFYEVCK